MKGGTLFVRVVKADRDRGYAMLVSWEKPVVQRTCIEMVSIGAITRASLDSAKERVLTVHNAGKIVDVTDTGLAKQLAKQFGEVPQKPAKVQAVSVSEAPAALL